MRLFMMLLALLITFAHATDSQEVLFDGENLFHEFVLKQDQTITRTVVDQLPDTCQRQVTVGHERVCENIPVEQCQTIPGACYQVPREICRNSEPVCRNTTREECQQRPREQCRPVQREVCTQPSPVCRDVPREECQQVPRENCHTTPAVCRDVPHQVCSNAPEICESVPRETCRPGERTCRRICNENTPRCMQCEAGPRVCSTTNERVCRPGARTCRTETRRECSPGQRVCHTTNERVCRTVNDRRCNTPPQQCRTVTEQQCQTTYERVCRQVPDSICHTPPPVCRTVSENVCDPDQQSCRTEYRQECRQVPQTRTESYACTRDVEREETVFDHHLFTKIRLHFLPHSRMTEARELFVLQKEPEIGLKLESSGLFYIYGQKRVAPITASGERDKEQIITYDLELELKELDEEIKKDGLKKLELSKEHFQVELRLPRKHHPTLKLNLYTIGTFGRVKNHVIKDSVIELQTTELEPIDNGLFRLKYKFPNELKKAKYRLDIEYSIDKLPELLNPQDFEVIKLNATLTKKI